jgi:hypothetical protein
VTVGLEDRGGVIRMRAVSSVCGREHGSFGEAVRSRASRWDLHGVDPRTGQDGVERRGELTGPVADEEAECGGSVVEVRQEVPGLLGGPRPGGVMAQSTWKKSTAGIVEACVRRNRAMSYRWTGTVPEVSPAA